LIEVFTEVLKLVWLRPDEGRSWSRLRREHGGDTGSGSLSLTCFRPFISDYARYDTWRKNMAIVTGPADVSASTPK
jgi:hypothetical protein